MESVNYHYHKAAGYLLFVPRFIAVTSWAVLSWCLITCSDLLGYNQLSSKLLKGYFSGTLRLLGVTIHCKGEQHLTEKPCIIVSNHINIYDHYIVSHILPIFPSFVATSRFNVFPISSVLSASNSILYDPQKRNNIVHTMKQRVSEGSQVTIYPDGCNPIPEKRLIAPFKNGAFIPKAPIQPMVIRYVSSCNTNMNWYYEDSRKNNTTFSLLKDCLLDGDIHAYITVLPVQEYKERYKSFEGYRDEIYDLMNMELVSLPKQRPHLKLQTSSDNTMMNYLLYLLYYGLFCFAIGNTYFSTMILFNFITGYFAHYYPTNNTRYLDVVVISYTVLSATFSSIQNQYDLYFRYCGILGYLVCLYRWTTYKNIVPFDTTRHIYSTWIPGYGMSLYPLLLNTLELYDII